MEENETEWNNDFAKFSQVFQNTRLNDDVAPLNMSTKHYGVCVFCFFSLCLKEWKNQAVKVWMT